MCLYMCACVCIKGERIGTGDERNLICKLEERVFHSRNKKHDWRRVLFGLEFEREGSRVEREREREREGE